MPLLSESIPTRTVDRSLSLRLYVAVHGGFTQAAMLSGFAESQPTIDYVGDDLRDLCCRGTLLGVTQSGLACQSTEYRF